MFLPSETYLTPFLLVLLSPLLPQAYAENQPWLRGPDLKWQADLEEDIAQDIKREDAATE